MPPAVEKDMPPMNMDVIKSILVVSLNLEIMPRLKPVVVYPEIVLNKAKVNVLFSILSINKYEI
jgi:hypothetical protein